MMPMQKYVAIGYYEANNNHQPIFLTQIELYRRLLHIVALAKYVRFAFFRYKFFPHMDKHKK